MVARQTDQQIKSIACVPFLQCAQAPVNVFRIITAEFSAAGYTGLLLVDLNHELLSGNLML